MKKCRKCGRIKPVFQFYSHSMMTDGRLNFCKSCVRSRVMEHRELNVERIREYDRNRGYRLGRQSAKSRRASSKVANAVRTGRLNRLPCIICGNPKSESHHTDYRRPLKVVFLCPIHHHRLHAGKFSLIPKYLSHGPHST